ncbi:ImmA/IrrE family metallo-endopeptidase [Paenibacillus azoreducens]|uniref:ImmA/IrrE family metallo-endopeptidase n=1 Tax=Paenibacillus azoreducens TaxID=116718 RepID=A0A919YNW5_9BACL|nr:ImmA/IrrE family metallo-endopeptidase [Paenibacillus azoreducens]GIO51652.1 ImmA/IrrE family metallo-endopeptidase [Paenibacillus azoreducens]
MEDEIKKLIRRFKSKDPFEIAEGLNIEIRFCDLGGNTRGLYYRKLRRKFIAIHEGLNDPWKRFVCAHELGHDRLHPGISRFFLDEYSFFSAGKFEHQANKFALKLLTAGSYIEQGESIEEFFIRNGIPKEMIKFYI